jgi:XrtJ-associated TM-motif-TM protein
MYAESGRLEHHVVFPDMNSGKNHKTPNSLDSLSVRLGLPVYHVGPHRRVYSLPIFFIRGLMTLSTRLRYLFSGLLLLSAPLLHAQGGCVNSPENPTVVLGLIGIAGALVIPVKNRLASFRRSRKNR